MKAIRFMAPEVIEVSDIPTPEPKDNEILAKIEYAGFCATDIELLTGEMVHIKNGNTTYPLVPGHEWSGTVVKVGAKVTNFKVGDKVTSDVSLGCGECGYCREGRYNVCVDRMVVGSYRNKQGVFAEYITVPQRHTYKVPESLSLEEAALAEPAGTSEYAVKRARIPAGADVLVVGDGPIGQLAAQLANIEGAGRVFLAGSWDSKLAIAKECGITEVINYHNEDVAARVKELTDGVGATIVIETSGSAAALSSSVAALKPGGRIVMVSWYNGAEISVPMNQVIAKDAELIGTLASPNTFDTVLRYMAEGKLKVKPLITQCVPVEEVGDIVRIARDRSVMRIKALLKP